MNDFFEPKILAFLCNWCSYAGADLAGISRIQYPPNIRVVRTMCSGRVDPEFIVDALKEGFDGVYIGGCHIGDCHYQDGNIYTLRRVEALKKLFEVSGIGEARVHLRWASAAEAQLFADNVTEVTEIIKTMGPFDTARHGLALNAAARTLASPRYRWLVGIDRQLTETANVYHEKTDPALFEHVMAQAMEDEYQKALLIEAMQDGPLSVKAMADITGLAVHTVSVRLNELESEGLAAIARVENRVPQFICRAA